MIKDVEVNIKEGFQKFRTGVCSVEKITLKPIPSRYISFIDRNDNLNIPIEAIRANASRELAKKIVSSLVYKKEVQGDETIYTFSVKDYSIKESEVKQQIINQLRDERNDLSTRVEVLLYENLRLVYVNEYNSRSLFQKIKDYILHRKKFNLKIKEYKNGK